MSTQTALIVIGRYKEEWNQLSPTQQTDFVERVGRTASTLGLGPVTGYRLTATPGAFIEIWESADAHSIENAIKNFKAIDYTQYVDVTRRVAARVADFDWIVGERAEAERA